MKVKILFLISILYLQCRPSSLPTLTDSNGVIVSLAPLWKTKITDDSDLAYIRTQLPYYNSTVVSGGTKDNRGRLVGLDTETGAILWEYNSLSIPTSSGISQSSKKHQFESKLYFINRSNEHLFIDIETGEVTSFETEAVFGKSELGIGSRFFKRMIKQTQEGGYFACIVENNIEAPGAFQDLFSPDYDFEYTTATGYHGYCAGRAIFTANGDDKMVIGFKQATEDPYKNKSFWGVFNLSTNEWEIEKTPIFEDSIESIFVVKHYDGMFYFTGSGHVLECIDYSTSETLWTKSIAGGLLFVEDHNLLLVSNTFDDKTHALNPQTGEELWHTSFSANSPLHYQDDVLYFIGAGNGRLHALDILTGQELWRLESPDAENNSHWKWEINGSPAQNGEKGKIFATSGLSAFCFEAVK